MNARQNRLVNLKKTNNEKAELYLKQLQEKAPFDEAAAAGQRVATIMQSNLITLPSLMLNPIVKRANLCLSARDAHHDGSDSHGIQTNRLFINVQKKMFGDNWANLCQRELVSRTDQDTSNGLWLSPPHEITTIQFRSLYSYGFTHSRRNAIFVLLYSR